MDISNLKRTPDKIKADLIISDKDVTTKGGCKIYFQERYEELGLAEIGNSVSLLGYYLILIGNDYGVSKAPTIIKTKPDDINIVKIDDESYYELTYYAGSTVIQNTQVVMDSNLLYPIWNEFVSKGKKPWFFDYKDMAALFEHSKHYTGVQLGANHGVWEVIAANLHRNPKNLMVQYRHVIKDTKELKSNPPEMVKLNSVTYGATNTTAKLLGGYFEEGVHSALLNPTSKKESIETLLRS